MVRHHLVWHDLVWHDLVWHDLVGHHLVRDYLVLIRRGEGGHAGVFGRSPHHL